MATPVVLDCDLTLDRPGDEPGDAVALAVLLAARNVEVAGITTTFGRAPVDVVYREARRLVRLLGREEVPVFRGAPWPGHRPTEAAHFLSRIARERPGEVVVAATGPLSNLLAAEELGRGFLADLGRVACAGGGGSRGTHPNLALDAAASRALLSCRRPVTVLPGGLCGRLTLGRRALGASRAWSPAARARLRRWLFRRLLARGGARLPLRDALPALYVARPSLFEDRSVVVSAADEDLTRGLLRVTGGAGGAVANVPVALRDEGAARALAMAALELLAASAALA